MARNEMILAMSESRMQAFRNILGNRYQLIECDNGAFAMKMMKLRKDSLAMAIIDVHMMEDNGFELLEAIRIFGLDVCPLIAVSEDASPAIINDAYSLGADAFLPYGISETIIDGQIRTILRASARLAELENMGRAIRNEADTNVDDITGLLNWNGFKKTAQVLLMNYPDQEYMLWYNEIHDFRRVMDRLGRKQAFEILKSWAHLGDSYISSGEAAARLSGDRFVALLAGGDVSDVLKAKAAVTDPVRGMLKDLGCDDVTLHSGVYFMRPEDRKHPNLDRMLARALTAQRAARDSGESVWKVYTPALSGGRDRIQAIKTGLSDALLSGDITVMYQPIVNHEGRLIAAEAKIGWSHKTLGVLTPEEFIPVIETAGTITLLDKFVWGEAAKVARSGLSVYVPVSPNDMTGINVPNTLRDITLQAGAPLGSLAARVDERHYRYDAKALMDLCERMKALRMPVVLSGFGKNESPLVLIRDYPVPWVMLESEGALEPLIDLVRSYGREVLLAREAPVEHVLGYAQGEALSAERLLSLYESKEKEGR